MGGQFVCVYDDSAVVLHTGAPANLVCFNCLENHNSHLQQVGIPPKMVHSTTARFKFGNGRIGEARYAADLKVGIAVRRGSIAVFALGEAIPASGSRGALEALGVNRILLGMC